MSEKRRSPYCKIMFSGCGNVYIGRVITFCATICFDVLWIKVWERMRFAYIVLFFEHIPTGAGSSSSAICWARERPLRKVEEYAGKSNRWNLRVSVVILSGR